MYSRIIHPQNKSFFLFGPRGTGKTTWLKTTYPDAVYIDLLESSIFNDLLADPARIEKFIPPKFNNWIILDEVQRVPALLNEVHRLIESRKIKFILTGSSARKLRARGTNLLAGRALTYRLYPLTAAELGRDFSIDHGLKFGHLPSAFNEKNPQKFLESYVMTYLEQEIQQEGLARNLGAFSRFLEAASFSQGSVLNISEVARECAVHRKAAENYFSILEDLMIAYRLPLFSKRAKRRLIAHSKFYFFDVGVYRTLRPHGPLDAPEEIEGVSLESLVLQELIAMNDYRNWQYDLAFWKTAQGNEVDFVLHGSKGFFGIEIKRTSKILPKHLKGLKLFLKDYPEATGYVLYGGSRKLWDGNIQIIPIADFLTNTEKYIVH